MRKIIVDFNNPADYDYESGGAGTIGELELFSTFSGHADELLWMNGTSRWTDNFNVPTDPHQGASDHLIVLSDEERFDVYNDFCYNNWMALVAPFGSEDLRTLFSVSSDTHTLNLKVGTSNDFSGTRIVFDVYKDDSLVGAFRTDPLDLVLGPWYHVAVTRRFGKIRLFLNGYQRGEGLFGESILAVNQVMVGCSEYRGDLVQFFQGYLDEVMFDNANHWWDADFLVPIEPFSVSYSFQHQPNRTAPDLTKELNINLSTQETSAGEVIPTFPNRALLDVSVSRIVPEDSYQSIIFTSVPTHYWQFNELGNVVVDHISNKNLQLYGNAHPGNQSQVNQSSLLMEKSGFMIAEEVHFQPPESFTVEFWYAYRNSTNKARNHAQAMMHFSDNFPAYIGDGNERLEISNTDQRYRVFNREVLTPGGVNLFDGQWHHVLLTFDHINEVLYYYLDNISNTSAVSAGWRWMGSGSKFIMGTVGELYGLYNDLALYTRYLPPEEVELHYTAGINQPISDIWLLDKVGNVVERHDSNTVYYAPPLEFRDLTDHSLFSLSGEGKGWSIIDDDEVNLYEQEAFEPFDLDRIIEIDFYYPNEYNLTVFLPKAAKWTKIILEVNTLQDFDFVDQYLRATIVDSDLNTIAVANIADLPSYIFLPSWAYIDGNNTADLLIMSHEQGNYYRPEVPIDNEIQHIDLNQTNPLYITPTTDYRLVMENFNLWTGIDHYPADGGIETELLTIGTIRSPNTFDISNGAGFDVNYELIPRNDSSTNYWFYVYRSSDDREWVRVRYYRYSNRRRFYFYSKINNTETNSYINVSEAYGENGYKVNVSYRPGEQLKLRIRRFTAVTTEWSLDRSVTLNLPSELNPSFYLGPNYTTQFQPGKIRMLQLANMKREDYFADLDHHDNHSNLILEFEDPYVSDSEPELFPITPDWRYSVTKIETHEGVALSDGELIHVHQFGDLDYVRGFAGTLNGEIQILSNVYENDAGLNLSLLNFNAGRLFERTIYDGDNGTKVIAPVLAGDINNPYLDPHDSKVVFSMSMDGANGGTTFIDNKEHTVGYAGGANLDTAQAKYGNASAYFDGNGDRVYSTSNDFILGTGDGTIEFWVRPTGTGTDAWARLVAIGTNTTKGGIYINRISSTNPFGIRVEGHDGSSYINLVDATDANIVYDTWSHVALCRKAGVFYLLINGVLMGSNGTYKTYVLSQSNISIGSNSSNSESLQGWIDDVRITKGHARYVDDFTPPLAINLYSSNTKLDFVVYGNELLTMDYITPDTIGIYDTIESVIAARPIDFRSLLGSEPVVHDGTTEMTYAVSTFYNEDSYPQNSTTNKGGHAESRFFKETTEEPTQQIAIVSPPISTSYNDPLLYLPLKNGDLKNYSSRYESKFDEGWIDGDYNVVPNRLGEPDSAIELHGSALHIPLVRRRTAFTIAFWMRDMIDASNQEWRYPVYINKKRSNYANFYFRFLYDGQWRVNYPSSASGRHWQDGYIYNRYTSSNFHDQWSHVTIEYDGSGDIYLFKNGSECSRTEYYNCYDYPMESFPYLMFGLKDNANSHFIFHDIMYFNKRVTSTERTRIREEPDYYHRKHQGQLYAGSELFESTESNVEILLEPALIIREKPLTTNTIIEFDYDLGTDADVDRHSHTLNGHFVALGTFSTDANCIFNCAERHENDLSVSIHYDYLGIVEKSNKLTPMRVGSV